MLDTLRISPYIVALRFGKNKYQRALDFKCATTLQQIDVAKLIAKMCVAKKLYMHKKRGFYPVYSKSPVRPPKDFAWVPFPVGVATVGALM